MKLVMKTLWLFLMKKRNIESWKKGLEWWIVKEVTLKKLVWLKKVKKVGINEVIKREVKIINYVSKDTTCEQFVKGNHIVESVEKILKT